MGRENVPGFQVFPLPMDFLSCRVIMTRTVNYRPCPFLCLVFVSRMKKCLCPIAMDILQRPVLPNNQIVILVFILEMLPR